MPHEMVEFPTMAMPADRTRTAERTRPAERPRAAERPRRRHTTGWPLETDKFTNRIEAGRALGAAMVGQLAPVGPDRTLVLGLPRGGMVIAREIAKMLDADLDVVVTRKVGLPWQPGFGIGAIADDGPPVFDRVALANAGTGTADLTSMVRRERLEVRRQQSHYRGERAAPPVCGRTVVIADDGMAPAVVARAAVRAVRAGSPAQVVYAAPVCAAELADWLRSEADSVLHLHSPRVFHALGLWYKDSSPVTDDDVARILAETWEEGPPRKGPKAARVGRKSTRVRPAAP